ncbi:MAG TPA: hypothetical protein VL172_19060, partial [Kofleriaceae bacterium]|nr:hypothetical protein [Kofleriaceae bacterium]
MRWFLVVALALGACGGDDDGTGARPDAGPDVIPKMRTTYVVSRIVVPADNTQLAASKFAFPGTQGMPVNKLGAVLQVMLDLLEGIPVQDMIDANLAAGAAAQALVFETDGPITGSDDQARGAWLPLADAGIDELSPTWPILIDDHGMITGTGTDTIDADVMVPVMATDPVHVAGVYQQIRGTADDAGFDGAIAGAITPEQLDADIVPGAAHLLDLAVQMGLPSAQQILDLLDGNADGRINAQDLLDSPLLDTLTTPDVDL